MVKNCKNCGAQLADDAEFCSECGAKFGQVFLNESGFNPFKTYKIDMIDGESVIRHSQIHKGCLYPPIAVMVIGFVIFLMPLLITVAYGYYLVPFDFIAPVLNPIFLVGLIWYIIRYIGYKNTDLILTNKRVFGKCGLINTTQMQSPLNKIDSVTFSNGLIGKLIGYGTVTISTTSSHFRFRYIRDGQSLYNDIFNQLEISEKEKVAYQADAIAEAISKN